MSRKWHVLIFENAIKNGCKINTVNLNGVHVDIAKEIVTKIVKAVKNTKQKTVGELLVYCNNFLRKYGELKESERKKLDREDIDLILILINYFGREYQLSGAYKIDRFISYIQNVINVDNPDGCVRIMSIHKSKGLESENVFVLNEGRPFVELGRSKDMIQQERNLSYVALTRAKEKLYLVRCKSDETEKNDTVDYEF